MDRCRTLLPLLLLAAVIAGCGTQSPSATDAAAPQSLAPSVPPLHAFAADAERISEHLAALQAIADGNDGTRFSGTPGYEASVDYAAEVLRDLGFAVETPEVEYTGFAELPGTTLQIGDRTFRGPDEVRALIYSASGDVTAPVAVLEENGCEAEDFEGIPSGSIVLTTGGGCLRRQQVVNAMDAGALALVVGYPGRGPGEIYRPTLADPEGIDIPVVSVTDDAIDAIESAGDNPVRLTVETEREPAVLRNVIAQFGDGEKYVMVGAHLDSVLEGAGINDNASGVAAVLEIARGVAEGGVPDGTAVRIGLWGGEELGLVGSRAYVQGLDDRPVAYLNIDMAGSLHGAAFVYNEAAVADQSGGITQGYVQWLTDRGEVPEPIDLHGASDHGSFQQAGIPTGGLFAGATQTGSAANPASPSPSGALNPPADACYHLACDDLDNVDVDRVALFADATLAIALALIGSS